MKALVKGLMIFFVGASCGSVITYFVTKDKIQKKADAEIEDMRKYVDEALAPYRKAEKMNQKAKEQAEKDIQESTKNVMKSASYVDYSAIHNDIIKEYGVENGEVIEEEVLATMEHPKDEDPNRGPYIISEDEWASHTPYYDKVELEYDISMATLYDSGNDQPEDPDCVGRDNLDIFYESDDDTMYVRNDRIGVDYLIIKVGG